MDKNRKKEEIKQYYNVTDFASEFFCPKTVFTQSIKDKSQNNNLLSIFSNLLHWGFNKENKKSERPQIKASSDILETNNTSQIESYYSTARKQHQLKYCLKLTMEHVLIGNENQLDALDIGEIQKNRVEAQKLWNIEIKAPISLVTVDMKKNIIAIISNFSSTLYLYRYNPKNISQQPTKLKYKLTQKQSKQLFFVKEVLYIVYEKQIQSFYVHDQVITKKQNKKYPIPIDMINQIRYLAAPAPIQSTINIFFEEPNKNKPTIFTLWVLSIEHSASQTKILNFKRVYEVQTALKNRLILKNFMRDTYLMNLGWQILAFKKGYVIDSVTLNVSLNHPNLMYLGEEKLVYVSDERVEIYELTIRTNIKPYRFRVKSQDAILYTPPKNSSFFTALEVFNKNLLLIFEETSTKKNKGEIKYWISVTQPITSKEKFDDFFDGRSIYDIQGQQMSQYFDMSEKMGLSAQKIYYELWNRSNKSEKDFDFLLETKNHALINQEVIKILKKRSLPFTQLYKMHKNRYFIHKQQVMELAHPTKEMFIGLIENSYILKKLEFFKDIWLLNQQSVSKKGSPKLMINIKTYNQINQLNLRQTLIELSKELALEGKPIESHIRVFLNIFKFPLRMIYEQLLSKIIEVLGKHFKVLVEKIPEILPCEMNDQEQLQNDYKLNGIWGEIDNYNKKNLLHFDNIVTIDNKQMITQVTKSLSFRRGFLNTHSFIVQNQEHINQTFTALNSEKIFYFVIQQIISIVKQNDARSAIFTVIENTYSSKLSHLKDKINLYYHIYYYLQGHQIVIEKDGAILEFNDFLYLKDYELFEHFFKIEKNRKGLILDEIKSIFDNINNNDPTVFNQCLLQYFKQPLSQLSDIKYLLNRINNQKKEFHIKNQHMYQVLVDAITYKLVVGTGHDIPFKQILIYIDNVPIHKNKEILSYLSVINNIDKNIQLIQAARVNMSINQIINSPNNFIGKMCEYLIIERNVSHHEDSQTVVKKSYSILASLQLMHNQIYNTQQDQFFYIFFIYIVKLAVDHRIFQSIKSIINDPYLIKQLKFTSQYLSDLIGFYLFKLSMSQNQAYIDNEKYLRGLISMFSQTSKIKQFIICQFQYAKNISGKGFKITYPLSLKYSSPGVKQFETVLQNLPVKSVLGIDIDTIYTLIVQMKNLSCEIISLMNIFESDDQQSNMESILRERSRPEIKKTKIYEVYIIKLLRMKKIKESIKFIDKYLQLCQEEEQSQSIVIVFLFLSEISENVNPKSLHLLFRICVYLFDHPVDIFNITKNFMLEPRNIKERYQYLQCQSLKCQQNQKKSLQKIFNNKLLNKKLIQTAIKKGLQHNLIRTLQQSYLHTVGSGQQFKNLIYNYGFIILISSPEFLPKYFLSLDKTQGIKNMKVFISFLAKQSCFDEINLLEFGSRLYLAILYSFVDEKEVVEVMDRISNLTDELDSQSYNINYDKSINLLRMLHKSSAYFREWKNKAVKKRQSEPPQQNYYEKLINPEIILEEKVIQIPAEKNGAVTQENKQDFAQQKDYHQFDEDLQIKKLLKKVKKKRGNQFHHQSRQQDNRQEDNRQKDNRQEDNRQLLQIEEKPHKQNEQQQPVYPVITVSVSHPKQSIISEQDVESKIKMYNPKVSMPSQGQENILKPHGELKQIIQLSSLQGFNQQSKEHPLEYKDFFGFTKGKDEQHNESSLLIPGIPKQYKPYNPVLQNESQDHQQNRSVASQKISLQSVEISQYKSFSKFPPIQQLGLTIYRNNLLLLDNPKVKSFKLLTLSQYETQPEFKEYMFEMIRYLYHETTETSLIGIMRMINFIINSFKLQIDKSLLQIWVRAQNLNNKYALEIQIRQLIPIQTLNIRGVIVQQIFDQTMSNVIKILDDINLYKIAKMLAITFQEPQYEHEVILAYIKKIAYGKSGKSQENTQDLVKERLEKLVEKLPVDIISEKMEEIYQNTNTEYQQNVLKGMVNKAKRQGSQQKTCSYC